MIFNYILRLSGVRSFSTVGGPCAENNIAPYLIKRLNEVADKNEINNLKKDCEEIDYSKSDNIDDDFKHFIQKALIEDNKDWYYYILKAIA